MLVFFIIYCTDNICNISLLGKFIPSTSKPNEPNFKSFGADLSEKKLFQCVSVLLTGTSTTKHGYYFTMDLTCYTMMIDV